jgi:hypothetical protein
MQSTCQRNRYLGCLLTAAAAAAAAPHELHGLPCFLGLGSPEIPPHQPVGGIISPVLDDRNVHRVLHHQCLAVSFPNQQGTFPAARCYTLHFLLEVLLKHTSIPVSIAPVTAVVALQTRVQQENIMQPAEVLAVWAKKEKAPAPAKRPLYMGQQ